MLKLLLGDPDTRRLKRYQPIISDINLLEDEISPLSDDELGIRQSTIKIFFPTNKILKSK